MGTSTFSHDGRQWLFAGAFGAVRVGFDKKLKLKLSTKFMSPAGSISINADGSVALVCGRAARGTGNDDATVLVNLPTLGIREKLSYALSAASLVTLASGDRIVSLEHGALVLYTLTGGVLTQERLVALSTPAAKLLDAPIIATAPSLGPTAERLAVTPDGRFLALTSTGLHAGILRPDAAHDAHFWTLPLTHLRATALGLTLTTDAAWLTALDPRSDEATLLRITRDGAVTTLVRKSLSLPAITDTLIVTQPDSATLEAFAPATGETRTYDVSAHNLHPAEMPESTAFPQGRPADPTRLPGHVAAHGDRLWFVPWHGEFVVDVIAPAAHDRELGAPAGPFRRLLLEELARANQHLRPLGVQSTLGSFAPHPKNRSIPFTSQLPMLDGSLRARLASCLVRELISRINLRTHGYSWGSCGMQGGVGYPMLPATLDDTREALAWMRGEDILPLEFAALMGRAYDEAMGIPSAPRPEEVPFDHASERLWTRAMLETLGERGWSMQEIPAAWASEAIEPTWAAQRVEALARWNRWQPYDLTKMLAKTLARHLGTDALPALYAMLAGCENEINWQQVRDAGEAIVWLCHQHPERKPEALDFIVREAARHTSGQHPHEFELVRGALARGARHLWSNG